MNERKITLIVKALYTIYNETNKIFSRVILNKKYSKRFDRMREIGNSWIKYVNSAALIPFQLNHKRGCKFCERQLFNLY